MRKTSPDERDYFIIKCLSEGRLQKDIAEVLGISERAVKKRLERLRLLYDRKNTTSLVIKMMETFDETKVNQL